MSSLRLLVLCPNVVVVTCAAIMSTLTLYQQQRLSCMSMCPALNLVHKNTGPSKVG